MDGRKRCSWVKGEALTEYHDHEWGRVVTDEQKLFEIFILEGFQAGLSWRTVLEKRENFRRAFDGFDARRIARYDESKIEALMKDQGIIRCRRKIEGAVQNAKVYLQIREQFGSLSTYLTGFTGERTTGNQTGETVTTSPVSDAISKDLQKRGMKFMGSVTVYSFMQAVGMVVDHERQCFLYRENEKAAE